jgi:hypothetical protein
MHMSMECGNTQDIGLGQQQNVLVTEWCIRIAFYNKN